MHLVHSPPADLCILSLQSKSILHWEVHLLTLEDRLLVRVNMDRDMNANSIKIRATKSAENFFQLLLNLFSPTVESYFRRVKVRIVTTVTFSLNNGTKKSRKAR
jgi:hypothetical protein